MDLKAVGQRIKAAREAKNLTQEESVSGVTNELSEMIEKLPKEKQQRIINAVRALVE